MSRFEKIRKLLEEYPTASLTLEQKPPLNLWFSYVKIKDTKEEFFIGNIKILKLAEWKELYRNLEIWLIEQTLEV